MSSVLLAGLTRSLTKEEVDGDGPSHTLLTLDGREDLGRVLERDRTLAERVADGEEVDEPATSASLPFLGASRRTRRQVQSDHHGYPGD